MYEGVQIGTPEWAVRFGLSLPGLGSVMASAGEAYSKSDTHITVLHLTRRCQQARFEVIVSKRRETPLQYQNNA